MKTETETMATAWAATAATVNVSEAFAKIETLARSEGVEVELLVERSEQFKVSYQKGRPEKFDSSTSQCAGLRVISAGYEGYSYSENLSDQALLAAYREALSNAKFTAKGGDAALKVKLLPAMTGTAEENPALFNESIAKIPVEEKLERARLLEATALEKDKRVAAVPYTGYVETESEFQILTSTGIRRRQRQTGVYGYTYCLAKEGEDSRMGSEAVFTRRADQLDVRKIASVAAERALAKLGAAPPETGMYPVVIDNEVASELFGLISDYFSAKSVFEKTSLFALELGKKVASSKITVLDDPFLESGMGTRSFDSEGAPVQKTPLIENGVLANFLTNSVYAERMGLKHTASASRGARDQLGISVSNMVIKPGEKSFEELMRLAPKVILVTDFTGYHAGFNEGSGDFSLSAEGELWENGKRIRPLCNFVVSGNIKDLLMKVDEVSSRLAPPISAVVSPDLFVSELSVAGR